ncbi:MAG: histidine phosphatase family protein [Actinomycetota bacterium]|nr:histidine phosphatase family protein [Actinomycetota bacterium]
MATRSLAGARPTVVCFVRHGTTPTTGTVLPGRARGLHLSEQGRSEADAAGARLAGLAAARAVYSSPLERARETARRVARHLGLPVSVERGLLECDFGEWTGAQLSALRALDAWETVQHHPSGFRFPGGESFPEVQARLAGAVERIVSRHPGEVVVAVSHADPIKIAVGDAMGVPLDLVQRTVISPCSVSAVAYAPSGPTVLCVNSTGDLRPLGIAHGPRKGRG